MRRSLIALNALVNLKRAQCLKSLCKGDHIHMGIAHFSSEEISKFVPAVDPLSEKLKIAQNGNYVNNLLLENSSSLTTTHLLIALNNLAERVRNDKNTNILETPHLQFLCTHLLKKVRLFELDHVVAIVGNLNFLKVPSDSVVMQTFLQIVRLHINELHFGQIQWLTSVLGKMSSTPLVDALKVALPLVLLNQLHLQMDRDDPVMLAKLFSYGCRHQFPMMDIAKIANPLFNLTKKWTFKDAMNVLWGTVYLQYPLLEFGQLVSIASDVIRKSVTEIPREALLKLLPRLLTANILSETLLRAVGRKAVSERWELNSVHELLLLFTNASILDADLLNFYASALEKDFQNGTIQLPVNEIVMMFAKPNFPPKNMTLLLKEFMKHVEVVSANKDTLIRYILNLIVLGATPAEVSTLLLDTEHDLLQHSKTADAQFLKNLTLLRAIVDKEHRKETLEIERVDVLRQSPRNTVPVDFPLKLALRMSFPNLKIYNGLVTRSGIYIDHLLLQSNHLDSESIPVSTSDLTRPFVAEEISLKTSKKIAILVNTADDYVRNTHHVNGERALTVYALKKAGFLVVQICLDQWNELLHHECVPYLERTIKIEVESQFFL